MPRFRWHRVATRVLAGTAIAGAAIVVVQTWGRLDKARELAAASRAIQAHPAQARLRLLVVGDSTAVGTGASTPERSVAGRLAAAMPDLAIDNLGENGARFADVVAQLERAPARRYDVVLVMAGGNDVIRLTDEAALRDDIDRVAALAKSRGSRVVLFPCGNVGNAPFFVRPFAWWMRARSIVLHALVRESADRHDAAYVSVYRERADDPFAREPGRYHAADGLHPGDEGYALWTDELLRQAPIVVAPRRDAATSS